MRITDLLKADGIKIGSAASSKMAAIDELVALHDKCGNLKDVVAYKEGILKREEMGTTAIGMEGQCSSGRHLRITHQCQCQHRWTLMNWIISEYYNQFGLQILTEK